MTIKSQQIRIKPDFILAISFFLMMVLLQACDTVESGNVDQQRIVTEFTMTYDLEEDKTLAKAVFLADETHLILSPPAEITFENTLLPKTETLGFVAYKKTFDGNYQTGTFFYSDLNGDEYTNTIVLADSLILADTLHLSLSGDGLLHWQGNPIAVNEEISAVIEASEGTLFLALNDQENASAIQFPTTEISEEFIGTHTIWMQRRETQDLQDATEAGGILKSVFQSNKAVLKITE